MKWVEHRLCPTFEALYGPGTDLGGAAGKKMICIMVCCSKNQTDLSISHSRHAQDNAPYHHKRDLWAAWRETLRENFTHEGHKKAQIRPVFGHLHPKMEWIPAGEATLPLPH